jgi:hypothetical protein
MQRAGAQQHLGKIPMLKVLVRPHLVIFLMQKDKIQSHMVRSLTLKAQKQQLE